MRSDWLKLKTSSQKARERLDCDIVVICSFDDPVLNLTFCYRWKIHIWPIPQNKTETNFILWNRQTIKSWKQNRLKYLVILYNMSVFCVDRFDTQLCDKVCKWLAAGRWYCPVSINKTDGHVHDITEILLKVALNTITLTRKLKMVTITP